MKELRLCLSYMYIYAKVYDVHTCVYVYNYSDH